MASSCNNSKRCERSGIEPNSASSSSVGQVLRPVVNRWLPTWATSSFRSNGAAAIADEHNGSMLPESAAVNDDFSASMAEAGTISLDQYRAQAVDTEVQLSAKITVVEQDQARQVEKAREVSGGLERAIEQCRQARERLSVLGEPIPQSSCENLSMLQESFLNFSAAVKLHEKKHSTVLRQIERLNEKHTALRISIEVAQAELSQIDNADNSNPDDFKHAA